jgi:hypothetical protein
MQQEQVEARTQDVFFLDTAPTLGGLVASASKLLEKKKRGFNDDCFIAYVWSESHRHRLYLMYV